MDCIFCGSRFGSSNKDDQVCSSCERAMRQLRLDMSPVRLKELAQAEKAGRLVVLPCKAGDTIYVIPSSENYALNLVNRLEKNNRVYKQTVSEIRFCRDDYLLTTCDGICSVLGQFFGENWFLTRQEAEEKLSDLWKNHKHLFCKEALREEADNG